MYKILKSHTLLFKVFRFSSPKKKSIVLDRNLIMTLGANT